MYILRHLLVAAFLVGAVSLQAAPLTFFSEDLNGNPNSRIAFPKSAAARANFLAQLSGTATDTFEEFSGGDSLPLNLTFSGAASATLRADAGFIQTLSSGTNGFGRFPTSGNNYLETNAPSLSFAFTAPVSSFGFYAIDAGSFGGQLSLVLTRSGGGNTTVAVPNSVGTGRGSPQNGSVLFFGYIDSASSFSNIQVLDSLQVDSFGLDDVTVGIRTSATTPEPYSGVLVGAGLLSIVLFGKKVRIGTIT
ncbi:MAG: hypothetical protein M3Z09_01690 [Acidobacteriota bacterium]|nr:hypothetical protein [Acidobacteriota bacterium]